MNRVVNFLHTIEKRLNFPTVTVIFDWGDDNLRIIKDNQVIFQQPSCYLYSISNDFLLSVGQEAYQLRGKNPPGTQIVYPMKKGAVFDLTQAEKMLSAVLETLNLKNNFPFWQKYKAIIILPNFANKLDKKIWKRLFNLVGWHKVYFLNQGQAVFQYLKNSKKIEKSDLLLVDIGARLTDLSFVINGEVLQTATIELGSAELTDNIRSQILSDYNFQINWQSAEKIKKQVHDNWILLGRKSKDDKEAAVFRQKLREQKINIRGLDLQKNLVNTKTINFEFLYQLVYLWAQRLNDKLKNHFVRVEPEQLVDALANGIYLTGGGSQLQGLDAFIQEEFKTTVIKAKRPDLIPVKGGATYVEY